MNECKWPTDCFKRERDRGFAGEIQAKQVKHHGWKINRVCPLQLVVKQFTFIGETGNYQPCVRKPTFLGEH